MKNRSTVSAAKQNAATSEPEHSDHKRSYSRKSLQCRLCLRTLPKDQLPSIFSGSGNLPKTIRLAVGTEVSKKDRSVRICFCCLELVNLVNDFRATCERSEVLFLQNTEISSDAFWIEESDPAVFGKGRKLVEQYKIKIEKLLSDQLEVICDVQTEQVLDASFVSDTNSVGESPVKQEYAVQIDDEGNAMIEKPEEEVYLEEEHLEEHHESEPDFGGSDFNDPDFIAEDQFEQYTEQSDDKESTENTTEKWEDVSLTEVPRRRGRPALPEELLKRRRRKPGEPKRKPGPKTKFKLPPQSVCEICGVLVNRENQERHRNEHLGNRPYACTLEGCTHAFSSKAGLHGHLARHADRDNIYDCDICGAKIKTKSSLHRHRKMHTAEKPHACDICGKRFWRKAYLNHHATVHTGVAKYPCEYCGFVFKNKYWRAFHVKQKHVAKGEAPKFEALEELAENAEMAEVMEEDEEMSGV